MAGEGKVNPMGATDPKEAASTRSRCTATARSGTRCSNPPVAGASVCRFHGGAAPQVRRKASLRLLELIDPAIATLAREMIQADKSNDRQRAANSLLDRAGVPRVVREVEQDVAKDLLLQRLREMRTQVPQGTMDDLGLGSDDWDEDEDEAGEHRPALEDFEPGYDDRGRPYPREPGILDDLDLDLQGLIDPTKNDDPEDRP